MGASSDPSQSVLVCAVSCPLCHLIISSITPTISLCPARTSCRRPPLLQPTLTSHLQSPQLAPRLSPENEFPGSQPTSPPRPTESNPQRVCRGWSWAPGRGQRLQTGREGSNGEAVCVGGGGEGRQAALALEVTWDLGAGRGLLDLLVLPAPPLAPASPGPGFLSGR